MEPASDDRSESVETQSDREVVVVRENLEATTGWSDAKQGFAVLRNDETVAPAMDEQHGHTQAARRRDHVDRRPVKSRQASGTVLDRVKIRVRKTTDHFQPGRACKLPDREFMSEPFLQFRLE